jgi:hypothetical protein
MKTVLVPTDFNPESTKIIDALVANLKNEPLKIIFLHAFKLSDSITDMLMLSRRNRDYENVSDEFYTQLRQYKEKYADHSFRIEYFYGSTAVAFRNFTEALEVDCIAYPRHYDFKKINKYSIDPKFLTERTDCKVISLDTYAVSEQDYSRESLMDTKIHEPQLQTSPV